MPPPAGAHDIARPEIGWWRIVVALVMTAGCAGFLVWMLWLVWPPAPAGPGAPANSTPANSEQVRGGPVPCVSYAPFRRSGHTPFDARLQIPREQIREDLRIISTLSRCVRTYGVDQGAEAVPAVARELGMQVVLGAWIGREALRNERELTRALALAREYRDVVRMLVVGNEVLLRGEQTPEAMGRLLARARAESPVPVTYADVWEFWLRHADALRRHVDVVTVHILPYWEDEPVGIAQAVPHVLAVTARVRERMGAQPLFIGETGWPAEGRQRGPARPGVEEQTRFVRELLAVQASLPPVNVIEAFDQPWKRRLEGAVGGQWGVWTASGEPRVHLAGAVTRPIWKDGVLWVAALAAAIGVAWAWDRAPRAGTGAGGRLVRCIAAGGVAALLGGATVWQVHLLAAISRTPLEWAAHGALALTAAITGVLSLRGLASQGARPSALWRGSGMVLMAGLVIVLWQLAWDGRYRVLLWPLPLAAAWAAAVYAAVHAPRHGHDAGQRGWLARAALAGLGSVGAGVMLWHEGPVNAQAHWLAAGWGALVFSAWWPGPAPAHPPAATTTGPEAAAT